MTVRAIFIVNLTPSRVFREERLSKGLSGSDWPVGVSAGDDLDDVNGGRTTQPVSGQYSQYSHCRKEERVDRVGVQACTPSFCSWLCL